MTSRIKATQFTRPLALAACLIGLSGLPALSLSASAEELSLKTFTGIDVGRGVMLVIEAGREQSVSATGEDRGHFRIEVKGDTLVVKAKGWSPWNDRDGETDLNIAVTMQKLEELEATTGAHVTAENIDSEELEIEVSTGALVTLSGRCGTLEIETSTGSRTNAEELLCEKVKAESSTGASLDVYASRSVRASASLGGKIDVHGDPEKRRVSEFLGGDVDF